MALFGKTKTRIAQEAADEAETVSAGEEGVAEEEYVPSDAMKRVLRARYLPGIQELNRQKEVAELAIGCFAKATQAINSIRPLIKEARALAGASRKVSSPAKKEALADRYASVRDKIDAIAKAACYKSVNLIDGSGVQLCLDMNSHYKASINIATINLTTDRKGLALPPVRFQFLKDVEAEDILKCATQAEGYLDWASDLLCKEAQLIAIRLAELMKSTKSVQ